MTQCKVKNLHKDEIELEVYAAVLSLQPTIIPRMRYRGDARNFFPDDTWGKVDILAVLVSSLLCWLLNFTAAFPLFLVSVIFCSLIMCCCCCLAVLVITFVSWYRCVVLHVGGYAWTMWDYSYAVEYHNTDCPLSFYALFYCDNHKICHVRLEMFLFTTNCKLFWRFKEKSLWNSLVYRMKIKFGNL